MIPNDPPEFTVPSLPPVFKKAKTPEELQAELTAAVEAKAKAQLARVIPPVEIPTPTILIPPGMAQGIASAKRQYLEQKAGFLADVEDELPVTQEELEEYQAEYDSYISSLQQYSNQINEFGDIE